MFDRFHSNSWKYFFWEKSLHFSIKISHIGKLTWKTLIYAGFRLIGTGKYEFLFFYSDQIYLVFLSEMIKKVRFFQIDLKAYFLR